MKRKKETGRGVYSLMVLLVSFLMASLVMSCDDNDNAGTARLEVRLTDAPGDYEEVNVDIQEVRVNTGDDNSNDDGAGWQSLPIKQGIYDLKKLTNGIDTLLCSVELPAGKISQIRLVLGSNNTVKVGGQLLPLTTPSAMQSGLKVQLHHELKSGITYKVLLDFDAVLSIVARGNDDYNLKPVIRAISEAQDGAIGGNVHPVEAMPTVYAIMGIDTISTSTNPESGAFLLRGLEAGTYRVVFVPTAAYKTKEMTTISVITGQVTNLDVVELEDL